MMRSGSGQWIKYFSTTPSPKWRLICFPFAGGGSNVYRRWASHVPDDVQLGAIALPGREARMSEPCVGRADVVCDAVVNDLMRINSNTPLALFGHSMGAILALEVAFRLKQRFDREPDLILVSGRRPPHVQFGGTYHLASDETFIEELKRLNGTPASVFEDEEMRRIALRILRHDYAIVETYQMSDTLRLTCPLVTCVSDRDTEASPEEMHLWAELTSGQCQHHVFPGDHFYINEQAATLAYFIGKCLSSFSGRATHSV